MNEFLLKHIDFYELKKIVDSKEQARTNIPYGANDEGE